MTYEELLKKISPKLRGIAYRLNSHFTFFNADDLYQEAAMHLWLDFKAGKLDDKTDSYILQGCYFHLKNYLRKVKEKIKFASLQALIDEEGISLEETLSLQNEPPQNYLDYLNSKMLVEIIQNNGLTPREKDILSLYAEGLTTRQIGKRIGISHVRVVKLLARIRVKSRKYLDVS